MLPRAAGTKRDSSTARRLVRATRTGGKKSRLFAQNDSVCVGARAEDVENVGRQERLPYQDLRRTASPLKR